MRRRRRPSRGAATRLRSRLGSPRQLDAVLTKEPGFKVSRVSQALPAPAGRNPARRRWTTPHTEQPAARHMFWSNDRQIHSCDCRSWFRVSNLNVAVDAGGGCSCFFCVLYAAQNSFLTPAQASAGRHTQPPHIELQPPAVHQASASLSHLPDCPATSPSPLAAAAARRRLTGELRV